MFKQYFRDFQLLQDLAGSVLRQNGLLKNKENKFWYHKTKEGIVFKIRRNVWDSAILIETWWLNEYLKGMKNLKNGGIVIDIGAHIGSFSLFIANKFKNVKVFAFEAHPDNFNILKENIALNHFKNRIFPFNLALDDKTGKRVKMSIHPDNLGMHCLSSLSLPNSVAKESSFEVETISLQDVFEKNQISRCEIVKMDCEGCEYPVLLSCSKNLLRKIENITMEYHKSGDIKELQGYLKRAGFETKTGQLISKGIFSLFVNAPFLKAWRNK